MNRIYQVMREREEQERMVLATVVRGKHTGEKLLVLGRGEGFVGMAQGFLQRHIAEFADLPSCRLLSLAGEDVFCERIRGRKTLIICGAGHVSLPIVEMGKRIGFYVIVIEDRPTFAEYARKAKADRVIRDSFAHGLDEIPGSTDSYFVIVTRDHRFDQQCLKMAVQKPNAYVGMMGSRRRVSMVKDRLQQEGIPKELLDGVCTPIGLDIGAESPEEIAVSVLAQIIQKKNEEKQISEYTPELLEALAVGEKSVLATIIAKNGSAPRDVGTKLLVWEDGTVIGTIGGGYVEGRIIRECLNMLQQDEEKYKCIREGMTASEAGEEGMACGGSIEVFLEKQIPSGYPVMHVPPEPALRGEI